MSLHQFLSVGPYPNSALSAGQLIMVAVVMLLALAVWLIGVFAADRPARRPTPDRPPAQAQAQAQDDGIVAMSDQVKADLSARA